MSKLDEMTSEAAAELALELIIYGWYTDALKGSKYSKPYTGTFEEYSAEYKYADSFDDSGTWGEIKYEGKSGTRDGFTAKLEAEHGGEGQGDQYWVVISLSDGTSTRYFRRDGWYASYSGGSLDGDTTEVRPAEKVVVVYE
jgi:hypothetical protein